MMLIYDAYICNIIENTKQKMKLLFVVNFGDLYMRPDMKNDRYEISNRFEFCFCLHEKIVSGRPENSCV